MARVQYQATEHEATSAGRELATQRQELAELTAALAKGPFDRAAVEVRWEIVRRCCLLAIKTARWNLSQVDPG